MAGDSGRLGELGFSNPLRPGHGFCFSSPEPRYSDCLGEEGYPPRRLPLILLSVAGRNRLCLRGPEHDQQPAHWPSSSVPGFSVEKIQNSGATSLTHLPPSIKTTVLVAYETIGAVFRVGLALVCLSMLGALSMQWLSVKRDIGKQKQEVVSREHWKDRG